MTAPNAIARAVKANSFLVAAEHIAWAIKDGQEARHVATALGLRSARSNNPSWELILRNLALRWQAIEMRRVRAIMGVCGGK